MSVENGEWIMRGLDWNDPYRIRTWQELVNWINEIGFLPLFGNEVEGFSAEEHTAPDYWWTGNRQEDPWEWREIIAASGQVAYGKFFGNKAGFISLDWLPYFANYRRNGYDFDARYQDGLASRREKKIMDFFIGEDEDGDAVYRDVRILSTDLKKEAGFGGGRKNAGGTEKLKNFAGVITGLQMQTYLVIADFQRRQNKRGEAYGMAVSILLPPETIWGYEKVTAAYSESPRASWERIVGCVRELYPDAAEADVIRLIGKAPVL